MSAMLVTILICFSTSVSAFLHFYVAFALIASKKTCTVSGFLLLHLSVCSTVTCILGFQAGFTISRSSSLSLFLCQVHGYFTEIIHPLVLWNLAFVHLDRFISIVHPLRYSSLLTLRRVVLLVVFSWILILLSTSPTLISRPGLSSNFSIGGGSCPPVWNSAPVYSIIYTFISYFTPILLMLIWNIYIVSIARHHEYRIANALFLITKQATRVREVQRTALQRFQGFTAILTLGQLLGSILILYTPYFTILIIEAFSTSASPIPIGVQWTCHVLLYISPFSNAIIYGIKSRNVRLTLLHYTRKQFYKSEVNREISRRSPAPCSRRPSISSLLSSFGGRSVEGVAAHLHAKLADIQGKGISYNETHKTVE
ncbi:histamine H2 receptor [Eurytemora carolleeae]|uniref:histamine H2 receptor n=1 Tax=Eurytemora carolleeae TaxID=1294199 RepID=UPI000C7565C9|nr:histamine H2 receptor [Eurytemora carolleeae]|eukprot:XP_023327903.1 histamine H2 receptor-like [Eurytemora affinis]